MSNKARALGHLEAACHAAHALHKKTPFEYGRFNSLVAELEGMLEEVEE